MFILLRILGWWGEEVVVCKRKEHKFENKVKIGAEARQATGNAEDDIEWVSEWERERWKLSSFIRDHYLLYSFSHVSTLLFRLPPFLALRDQTRTQFRNWNQLVRRANFFIFTLRSFFFTFLGCGKTWKQAVEKLRYEWENWIKVRLWNYNVGTHRRTGIKSLFSFAFARTTSNCDAEILMGKAV